MNDKFHKNELTVSKSRLFFISPEREDTIAEPWMFFSKTVELLLLLHNIFMVKVDERRIYRYIGVVFFGFSLFLLILFFPLLMWFLFLVYEELCCFVVYEGLALLFFDN